MIRDATLTDVPQIATLFARSRKAAMPWLPVLHTHDEDIGFFQKKVLSHFNFKVFDNGEILGFVAFEEGWVHHLYVDPDFLRQGIGAQVLAQAMTHARNLDLWVFEQNRNAQAFYAAHGFTVTERTDGSSNEERCPDLKMTWTAP